MSPLPRLTEFVTDIRTQKKIIMLMLFMAVGFILGHSSAVLGTLDLQLDEEQPAGTIVGDISTGLPPGTTATLFFISDVSGTGVSSDLNIDETTGIIKTAKVLDRETRDHYNFIAVTMQGLTVDVTILVNDINDHSPIFPKSRASLRIPEQTTVGAKFPLDPATDADKGQFSIQGYLITEGNLDHDFRLETKQGSKDILYLYLVVNGVLDREKRSFYSLALEAFDGGTPKKTGQMILDITIQDINDHAPIFNQTRYHALISENMQPGSSVLQVFATDADEGDNGLVLYEINRRQSDPEKYFLIDAHTGIITLNKPLDYEMKKVHELVVQARDNASQPEITNSFVTIHVRDYNDNQPTMTIIFLSEDGSPHISEGAQPGQYVARISVSDPDYGEYSNVNVSLEGGDGKFGLTTKDNIIYLICVDSILDREERDSYELRVTATDSGTPPLRAESSFKLQVTDINDNPPLFDQKVYQQGIAEMVYPGSFVLQVTARDKDDGPNGHVRYSILKDHGTHSDWFKIDPNTGIITTATEIDYETDPWPRITVIATDGGQPALSSTAIINIIVQDINDNKPFFGSESYNISLDEDTAVGSCFLKVTATDADRGSFGKISYSIGSGTGSVIPSQFTINKETGEICTVLPLDRDQGQATYEFTVTAMDGGGLCSVAHVKVVLIDMNDNRPVFYPISYAVSLSTQSSPGTSVVKVIAHDQDEGENAKVIYDIAPGGSSPYFTLNKDTGVISLSRSLHGKENSVIHLVITAQDGSGQTALVNARVNISIVEGSVTPPVFEQTHYFFTIYEDVLRGTPVGTIQAKNENGDSKAVYYTISSGDPYGFFTVDPDTGVLRTSLSLDHEIQQFVELEVQAWSGTPPSFGKTTVKIIIADRNDNAPMFLPSSSESLLLPEETEIGSLVYRVSAVDKDSSLNSQLSFELTSSEGLRTFSIDRSLGEICLIGSLNYETMPHYDLRIVVKDHGVPQLSSTFTLVVYVQDENDQGPVFDTLTYRVELKEGIQLNTRFLQVRALNRETSSLTGPLSTVVYHLRTDGDSTGFGIVADSGWLFVKSVLDRETKDVYLLTVLASSGAGNLKKTGSATVRVSVTDENDNAPRLSQERVFLALSENMPPGTGFGRVTASDRDAGFNSVLSFRLMYSDQNFQINSETGEISTRIILDREHQSSYQLIVVVQDGGTPPRSSTGTIFITVLDENDNAPSFVHIPPGQGITMQVSEGMPLGTVLGFIQAKDPDEGENGTVYYSLSGFRAERFLLNPHTGELSLSVPVNHPEKAEYFFTVTATDRGSPSKSTSVTLCVKVLNTSKNAANPDLPLITLGLTEGMKPGSVVGSLASHVHGRMSHEVQVTYMIVGGTDYQGTFAVDRLTGDIYLARDLDYELSSKYTLQIQVNDMLSALPTSQTIVVDISVQDSNDHSPQFPEDPLTIVIPENLEAGSSVYTLQAVDKDGSGPNSELYYSIVYQLPENNDHLKLDAATGVMTLPRSIDRENTPSLLLVVQAMDRALNISQRRSSSVTVRIFITDENDNAPAFTSPAAVSVMEDQPAGFVVLYVMARDPDLGENGQISYRIKSGNTGGKFSLNPSTGSLSILKALDREEQGLYNLTLVAEDHGSPMLSTEQLLSVHVIDVNDEVPQFEKAEFETQILENQKIGTSVLTLTAVDRDQGSNGVVTYGSILDDSFSMDSATGVIKTMKSLDRETKDLYIFTAYAEDGGSPPNFAKATIKIKVLDENDNAPVFEKDLYYLEVPENQDPSALMTIKARDSDAGENGKTEYKIIDGDPYGDFIIHSSSGVFSPSRPLDRERIARYSLTIMARDLGKPALSSTATVTVVVLDINDNYPTFADSAFIVDTDEDAQVGTLILDVTASDADYGDNGRLLYFLSKESLSMFSINQETGRITTAALLDREKRATYRFQVVAIDCSTVIPKNATIPVTVNIRDVNDNSPFFIQDPLVINISQDASINNVIATMRAEDKDFGANASIFYRFTTSVSGFSINSFSGEIRLLRTLSMMSQKERTLFVIATDQGTPARSSTGVVVIYIKEEEYKGVRFPRNFKDVSLQENAKRGTTVTRIQAHNSDGSSKGILYSIFSGNLLNSFIIQQNTGEIKVQNSNGLDFEQTPRLRLVVKAESSSSFSFMALNLNLQDVNDNLPRFQLQNYFVYIKEGHEYNFPIIQVLADDVDQGQNGQVTYSIQSSSMSGLFRIDPVTGSITTAAIMDREIWMKTTLVVAATDKGTPRLAGTASLTVIIMDMDDNSPTIPLLKEVRVPENASVGMEITQVTGNDVDTEPALSYSLLFDANSMEKFCINQYTGTISLIAPLDFEEKRSYTFKVQTSDSKHKTEVNLTFVVEDVNDNAPVFTQELYQVYLPEHSLPGSQVVTVTATDQDSGENGKVTYRVVSSNKDKFYIDPMNGTLFISQKAEFDPEQPSLRVVIEAQDGGTPALTSNTIVYVQVSDLNDNEPHFQQSEYKATVSEDLLPGSTILTFEAIDNDVSRDNCGFDFGIAVGNLGSAFQIESSVRFLEGRGFQTIGTLILVEHLDFETVPWYNLTIVASDHGVPQRSSSVPVIINVMDVNDNPPVFGHTEYSIVLSEGAAAGTEILRLSASDLDSAPNAVVQYAILSGDEEKIFRVDEWTGSLKLLSPLDREGRAKYMVIVKASDKQGQYDLVAVTIEVKDINDNKPYFPLSTLTASIRENQPTNALVTILHAIDADYGDYGQLSYYMIDQSGESKVAFTLNLTTGEVRSQMTFDFEKISTFHFVALALDSGNYSATMTVQVLVIGEDEYDPVFIAPLYSFEVPEGSLKGQSIGQVVASDEDGGPDGIVLYTFASSSPYFGVNETTGIIYLKMDSHIQYSRGGRSRRETRQITLEVKAHSPLPSSRSATALVNVDVTHTSFGLTSEVNLLLISVIAASLGVIVILLGIAIVLFVIRSRRLHKDENARINSPATINVVQKGDEDKLSGDERMYHQTLPGYSGEKMSGMGGTGGMSYTRGGSLDPSHSSGRGSAEAEAAEDDEIRMINEYPRMSSITSSMQDHISTRGPDSGIQQDADQLSDISCDPAVDAGQWFKGKKGGSICGTMLSGQHPIYRDEAVGYLGVGRGLNISHSKDYAFPEDGKPLVDGSLTAIVASDEELRGSYNWDYLLNWCPQFQPLANVFTEIARLKDESAPPNLRRPFQPKTKIDPKPRIDPPPLITSVAHPGAKSVPPKPATGQIFPIFSSLRRSPINHEGSISSAAMSPSFSPSLSPLAARSPAVSPFAITQGPSASMISPTENTLDHSEEAEIRI
ncbi:protocadherin-16-like isoform X2 [Polypterus senegalus]|nr:protocadherin-16-like isoform X2 [Polypterus senegalus]